MHIVTYRMGETYYCTIDNVDPGARFARAEGATREDAERVALEKATKVSAARPAGFPLQRTSAQRVIAIPASISELQQRLAGQHYIADRGLAIALFLALRLKRPLFLEGESGVGKTALAAAAAAARRTRSHSPAVLRGSRRRSRSVRVGLRAPAPRAAHPRGDAHARSGKRAARSLQRDAFSSSVRCSRRSIRARARPAVLLIDEIDRADEEFEGFLLELLSEFQITIPELGTVRASEPPLVILTSNRTREVHDALKRRCLYQWIEYPSFEKEAGDRPRARA